MATKLLNLIALSSLAILACSFGATPVNALSLESSPNHARHLGHHQLLAKKKRTDSRRCKQRPSSSSAASASSTAGPTSSKKPASTPTPPANGGGKGTTPPPPPPPPPAPPSGGGHAGGGKVGLAWSNGEDQFLKNFVTSKVSTIYSWSPFKPAGVDALGLNFAPMFWGPKQASDFQRLAVAGYGTHALGFNEPDLAGQSNINPSYGAQLWKQYMQPLKGKGYTLVSPAVTSGSSGKPWLQNFIKACDGCSIDVIALHWYGTNPNELIAYIKDFHTTFGKNIWVTEFACQDFAGGPQASQSQVNSFMSQVTAFMDGADYVEHYFAFGLMHDMLGVNTANQLMAGNNAPTALGFQYLN